jgi:hypothetical protein
LPVASEWQPSVVLRGPDETWLVVAGSHLDPRSRRIFTGRGQTLTERRVLGSGSDLGGMTTIEFDLDGRWLTLELHSGINATVPARLRLGRERLSPLTLAPELPRGLRFVCLQSERWTFRLSQP